MTDVAAERAAIAILEAVLRTRLDEMGLTHWTTSVWFPVDRVADVQLHFEDPQRPIHGRMVLLPRSDVLTFAISEQSRERIFRAIDATTPHLPR